MQDDKFTEKQERIFLLKWNDCRSKLAPDIEGELMKSHNFADKVLDYAVE